MKASYPLLLTDKQEGKREEDEQGKQVGEWERERSQTLFSVWATGKRGDSLNILLKMKMPVKEIKLIHSYNTFSDLTKERP